MNVHEKAGVSGERVTGENAKATAVPPRGGAGAMNEPSATATRRPGDYGSTSSHHSKPRLTYGPMVQLQSTIPNRDCSSHHSKPRLWFNPPFQSTVVATAGKMRGTVARERCVFVLAPVRNGSLSQRKPKNTDNYCRKVAPRAPRPRPRPAR